MTAFQRLLTSLTHKDVAGTQRCSFSLVGKVIVLGRICSNTWLHSSLKLNFSPVFFFPPLFYRARTSGCRCTRSWWKSPTSSTLWVAPSCLTFLCLSPQLACVSSILSLFFQTCKTAKQLAWHSRYATHANRPFLPSPRGRERRTFASLRPLKTSTTVWRGERSCPWQRSEQTQQSVLQNCIVLTANMSRCYSFSRYYMRSHVTCHPVYCHMS